MATQNNHNGKGLYVAVAVALVLCLVSIGVSVFLISDVKTLNKEVAQSNNDWHTAVAAIGTSIGQMTNNFNQQTVQTNNQLRDITNQLQSQTTNLNNTIAGLKAGIDTANAKLADVQKQEQASQATIANLQTANSNLTTTVNSLQTKLQQSYYQYPYQYPYQPNAYPYPCPYPYNPLVVTVQNNSGVLTLSTRIYEQNQRFYTTSTLTGYVTLVVTNPASYDVTNAVLNIDFQLSGVPSIQSCNPQLSGNNISWTATVVNPNELEFQTAQWGVRIAAGQSLNIPLTLTASTLANFGWAQSYRFQVSVSVN